MMTGNQAAEVLEQFDIQPKWRGNRIVPDAILPIGEGHTAITRRNGYSKVWTAEQQLLDLGIDAL